MQLPFEYDSVAVGSYGGTLPTMPDFDSARVVILPIPLDRTTSYVGGTRNGLAMGWDACRIASHSGNS